MITDADGVTQTESVVIEVSSPEEKIIASDGSASDQFGHASSISGDYAIVGFDDHAVNVISLPSANLIIVRFIESEILDYYKGKKAILIEAFAPGNVPFAYSHWIEGIKKATKNKTSIFVTTQNPFGEVDMEMYEVGQRAMKAGAISCHDMLPEAALVKLMWIW
jgi:L-asparaginase/archaeal Glu-tRNAGln amidotransferase subunit D